MARLVRRVSSYGEARGGSLDYGPVAVEVDGADKSPADVAGRESSLDVDERVLIFFQYSGDLLRVFFYSFLRRRLTVGPEVRLGEDEPERRRAARRRPFRSFPVRGVGRVLVARYDGSDVPSFVFRRKVGEEKVAFSENAHSVSPFLFL